MSATTEEEKYAQRRQKELEKARRYREKKKLEGKWKYSVSSIEKINPQSSRTRLYHWFILQGLTKDSVIQKKINQTPVFNQTYEIVVSPITKMPVIHRRNFDKAIYTHECRAVQQEIKSLFEDWLKIDEEFYSAILTDETFSKQFKISRRAVKREDCGESVEQQ